MTLYEYHCIRGENWIDFESEIRFIIKAVDENTSLLSDPWESVIEEALGSQMNLRIKTFKDKLKFMRYARKQCWSLEHKPTIRDFRAKAFEDLERLIRAFELYLVTFVEKIQMHKKIPELTEIYPDYVINFNYTNTYEKWYNRGKVYHIHGEACEKRSPKENNMVLGIDEYWTGKDRDERTNFTVFKKFSQRIQKHTGSDGYKYLREIEKIFNSSGAVWSGNVDTSKVHSDGTSYVYIFGHSLDITDKDILSGFIGIDSTAVTVYCMDKGAEGELIANTIKLIGEEKLLDKTNCVPSKSEYIIPKDNKNQETVNFL